MSKKICPKRKTRLAVKIFIAAGIIFTLVFLFAGSCLAYVKFYEGRVYPGVYVGNYHLGGLNETEIKNLVETFNSRLFKEGLNFFVKDLSGHRTNLKFNNIKSADAAKILVEVDGEKLARDALAVGRAERRARHEKWLMPFFYRFVKNKELRADTFWDEQGFLESLRSVFSALVRETSDAGVKIKNSDVNNLEYEIVPERSGAEFLYHDILQRVKRNISVLSFAPVDAVAQKTEPSVKMADVKEALKGLPSIMEYGAIALKYANPLTGRETDLTIAVEEYLKWLKTARDKKGRLIFILDEKGLKKYLEVIGYDINKPAQDAKFAIDGGRVKEFQANRSGVLLNQSKSREDISRTFLARNYAGGNPPTPVALTVEVVKPKVKISDVNDLNINGIIGAGTSTFYDSHTNRIKNIANAVKRLNGVLIKPDEIFSAIKYAGSFTVENGFLPEDIIKGDKIKKEVGGGMCQIGTTLFRMAMNSGMPITNRRNHSLVVHYYADPVNGNPGTDAAVYEPNVDFNFLNDTGNYLLLQTEIDYKKKMLTFTLWGKPDGRRGWYSHPIVKKWIPAGEKKELEVENLKPGEEIKSQNAFKGAIASFTYTRYTPSGEKIERIFDSYYRPLPQMCFVPKKPDSNCPSGQICAPSAPTADSSSLTATPAGEQDAIEEINVEL